MTIAVRIRDNRYLAKGTTQQPVNGYFESLPGGPSDCREAARTDAPHATPKSDLPSRAMSRLVAMSYGARRGNSRPAPHTSSKDANFFPCIAGRGNDIEGAPCSQITSQCGNC